MAVTTNKTDKEKLYHFCAMRQLKNGTIHYFDGLVSANINIKDNSYYKIKCNISNAMEGDVKEADITLLSLSKVS